MSTGVDRTLYRLVLFAAVALATCENSSPTSLTGSSDIPSRELAGASSPYQIPGVISLTDSAFGFGAFSGWYFFLYDWQVTW